MIEFLILAIIQLVKRLWNWMYFSLVLLRTDSSKDLVLPPSPLLPTSSLPPPVGERVWLHLPPGPVAHHAAAAH